EAAVVEDHLADGHFARQDTGDGAEGDLGAPVGVQPGAGGDGQGGQAGAAVSGGDQLQGDFADLECLPAAVAVGGDDCRTGGVVAGGAPSRRQASGGQATGSV